MPGRLLRPNPNAKSFRHFKRAFSSPSFPPPVTPPVIHQCKTPSQAKLIHQHLLTAGTLSLNLTSHLISTYVSLGSSSSALSLLLRFPPSPAAVYHWNSLIRRALHHGFLHETVSLFCLMRSLSWTPDNYTFPFVLKASGETRSLRFGVCVHALACSSGFGSNVFVGNALVTMYARCDALHNARNMFDEMLKRNFWDVVSWNSMMAAYVQAGDSKKSIQLFYRMTNEFGATPDVISLVNALPSCASLSSSVKGKQIHGFAIRIGLIEDVFVGNGVVDMYAKCGMMGEADKVFQSMKLKDVVSWNAMVTGYSQIGRFDDALSLFEKMRCENIALDVVTWSAVIAGYAQRDLGYGALDVFRQMMFSGSEPNEVTLVSVLSGCAAVGALLLGKQIHCYAVKLVLGFEGSEVGDDNMVANALIDMYAKCKRDNVARAMFDLVAPEDRNVVTWTVMIGGYAQHGEANEALGLLSEMLKQPNHTKPNAFTISCALMACARLAALRFGRQIHGYVLRNQFDSVMLFVSNSLVDMYVKCGDIGDAQIVFDNMVERNEVSWTTLMTGYGMHGRGEEAVRVFDEMREKGFVPDSVTFLVVLYACSHSGMVDQGMEYFTRMKNEFDVVPGPEHYACAVDLLGRSGKLDEALKLIEEMPADPTAVVWVALLSGCRIHGNVELGEYAAEKLSELASDNDGSYTLLSNLYANARRWKDVARIRSLMRHTGIKKRPGCSWVQGAKSTATFFVGDKNHPLSGDIYRVLTDLIQRIKDMGYVPETSFALHDVDDEEKGDLLFEHSEKLALAYGVLTTPLGSPIRITKNLRVCGDCHTAFIYISKIVDHEIILRDSSRFHHFKNGSCSCRGYW